MVNSLLDDDDQKELDKLYEELELYLEDFDFQNYILPLLEEKYLDTDKIANLKKIFEYYKNEGVLLPVIDDQRYQFIQNYQEFEFTNCIAYEMVIRTDEFKKAEFLYMTIQDLKAILNLPFFNYEDIQNELRDACQFLHQDIQKILLKYINRQGSHNELDNIITDLSKEFENSKLILKDLGVLNIIPFLSQDMFDFTDYKFTLLDQIQENLTLADFNNGLDLLITYYLPKGKIYKKIGDTVEFEKINSSINKVQKDILEDIKSYYIYIDPVIVQLSENISIFQFDKEFQDYIKKHYNNYKYIDTQPNYTRPALHFLNAKIINLPINLSFSEDEITSLVLKIKQDYDTKQGLIKTPIEELGEKLENFTKPKSEKKLPSKNKIDKNKAFANAFCVYDLDKVLTPIFKRKQKEFKQKQKKGELAKDEVNPYSAEYLKSEISSITGVSEDNIKIYRTLMKDYIDNKKFIGLITGISESKK